MERLCALVPKLRKHLVTYHGVLAPAAGIAFAGGAQARGRGAGRRTLQSRNGWRCGGCACAVATNGEDVAFRRRQLQRRLRERLRVPHGGGKRSGGRRRYPWASLLMRV